MLARLLLPLVIALHVGCARSTEGAVRPDRVDDVDGDGFVAAIDCDDASAAVFPAAPEVCNGVDDDCDGTVDVDAGDEATWFHDADGDGYGGPTEGLACLPPEGHVALDGDCDDADPEVNPSAVERCGGGDEDCDGLEGDDDPDVADALTWFADADADGFGDPEVATAACAVPAGHVAGASDCDDASAGVFPGAAETCDGVDEDCDGEVDDGAIVDVYADGDGDGYGDPGRALAACPAPEGYVLVAGDCDDMDPAANPGGVEVCDADDADEDCDGSADDADPDAVGSTWWADADGDGYGDAAVPVTACEVPAAYVADAADCDDADAATNPGAVEVCNDADDDCDGSVDGSTTADATTWYADADGDGYGDASAATSACDAPTGYVADDEDCADDDAVRNPAAAETCDDGVDDDCDGIDTVCDRMSGTVRIRTSALLSVAAADADDAAGWSVAFGGDLDGDGLDDLLIGAPQNDESGNYNGGNGGAFHAFYADHAGSESVTSADVTLLGEIGERAGLAVAAAGDVRADGRPWVIVGGLGAAYVIPEPYSMNLGEAYGDGALVCRDEETDDMAGWAVAGAGDVDGDGGADPLVGAPYNDDGGASAGRVYRGCEWWGSGGYAAYWVASYTGEAAGDLAGAALSGAGDLDGDGLADFLIGAPYNDEADTSAGKVYVVLGGGSSGDLDLSSADASWTGIGAGRLAGASLWGGADLDEDGYDDIGIGSGGEGAWVVFGTVAAAASSLVDADVEIVGEADGDAAGWDLSGGADVDGDGVADLVVAAPGSDRAATDGGAVYVVAGPLVGGSIDLAAADAFLVLDEADGAAGWSVDATGDADGDGVADVLVGAPGVAGAGAVFLVPGGP